MTREELKLALPATPSKECDVCKKEMSFVYNVETRKDGPIDLRCAVYFVRKVVDGQGRPLAMTASDLMDILKRVVVEVDGQEVTYQADEILGFFVSHFSTCPGAARMSQRRRRR